MNKQRISVLGTGMVGVTIASMLIDLGYEVRMRSRTADNEKAQRWAQSMGSNASHGILPMRQTLGN